MAAPRSIKSALATLLKLALAVVLIIWLVKSGKLEFRQLLIVVRDPWILLLTVATWVISPIILGGLRWLLLLQGAGYQISVLRAINLQMIGFFFNAAMPGAVGGDLVKAMYVIRDNRDQGKTPAMMSIILDRILGIFGLFTIGFVVVLFNWSTVMENSLLQPMAALIFAVMLFSVLMFASAFVKYRSANDPILRLLSYDLPGLSLLKKIYLTFRRYHDNRRFLMISWGISIVSQLLLLSYFIVLTQAMVSGPVKISNIAMIFPIGVLTSALPIAPGGLGVGHVAFDSLFHLVGLNNGANVFNVYILSSLALSLSGAIPYLFYKKQAPLTPAEVVN